MNNSVNIFENTVNNSVRPNYISSCFIVSYLIRLLSYCGVKKGFGKDWF